MPQLQRYLPIVESGKESKILGLIDLAANVAFEGDETTLAFTNSASVSVPITLFKYVPTLSPSRDQAEWYMVATFTHEEIVARAYLSYTFVQIKDVLPAAQWSSGSGKANHLTTFDGLILTGLKATHGFATGLPAVNVAPVNTVLPAISGTATAGQLQTSTEGTWTGSAAFKYQWQVNTASVWTDIAGEIGLTYTPALAGTYRIRVTAYNQHGKTEAFSADRVIL